jgi:tetratricopeptide (TPR) repeat protein
MPIAGQPPASPALQQALDLLAAGKPDEADEVVTRAAKSAKARFGSGSHPLAQGYADMARLHHRMGKFKRAAAEFKHATETPMPADAAGRADRLSFMFGFAACLEELDQPDDSEKVLRQCVVFARNLHGPSTPGSAAAIEPLASLLLKLGKTAEAVQLLDEAYDVLWTHGDPSITAILPARAEALKAVGRPEDPFCDLSQLPENLASDAVAQVLGRSGAGDGVRLRQVFADLLKFVDHRFGDGHSATADTLAAIVHHEAALGEKRDAKVQMVAARRALWSYAVRQAPAGLLENLEVGFENGGTIHLVPHLAREPSPNEAEQIESILTDAVDDLYSRPKPKR